MKNLLLILIIGISFTMCSNTITTVSTPVFEESEFKTEINFLDSDEKVFIGTYIGLENTKTNDMYYEFAEQICFSVDLKLKELYDVGIYSKVDLEQIWMSSEGYGTTTVKYQIVIPLIQVSKDDAMLSFTHSQSSSLKRKEKELRKEIIYMSLKETPEGLSEYWIQWK